MHSVRDFADRGCSKVTSAAPVTSGDHYGLIVTTECVVDTATFVHSDIYSAADMLDGVTLPIGFYPFRIKTLSLTSGVAFAMKN
jgi:hypothetical protein